MRLLHGAITALALSIAAASSAAPDQAGKGAIRFPEVTPTPPAPAPAPAPQPAPTGPAKLAADSLYVIDSDVPLLVFASPEGLVKVTKEAGPLKVRGKFVGGGDGYETRTFAGKHVVVVEAVAGQSGVVELIVVPTGALEEKAAVRKRVEVGQGPRPPPDPEPKPDDPDPPTPAPQGFRVIFVYETSTTLTQGQYDAMFARSVSDYLNAKTAKHNGHPEWRRFDKDVDPSKDSPELKALWNAAKSKVGTIPAVIVAVDGKANVLPLPGSAAESLALLKKYGGE